MTVQTATALALKEWAAVIDAMAAGRQAVTLRKGGVREKSFLVQGRSFYLLPTFAHEAPELIKPEFRQTVERALAEQRDESGLIVRARADVAGLWEIDDERRLDALQPYQMFTAEYARSRFAWRPRQPLTVMLLRVHRLAEAWHTGLPSGVGGCRSWIEVNATAAPAAEQAALDERDFERLSADLHRLLD